MLPCLLFSVICLQLVSTLPTDFSDSQFGFNHSKWYRDKDITHGSSRRYKPNDIGNSVLLPDRLSPPLDDGIGLEYCPRKAKCHSHNNATCFGAKLPYPMTTFDLVPGITSQEQITYHFSVWKRLINLPRCWAVIQPFLCSLYMPKCEDDVVYLPSQEMCKVLLGPCRILTEEHAWPMSLECHNTTIFPRGCKNDMMWRVSFNTSGKCREPMVATDSPSSYYDGMETCGVQCDNPMFTPDERFQIHRLVAWGATICFLFNLFTVATFMIEWKSFSKYPALVTFYINLCWMIMCVGWLLQFLPENREDIVCRKDGTLRVGEPNARENLSCVVVFVLVYYFFMAGIVWFVILTYAYHISFEALGKIQERMDKKGAYFHLVAWSLPLVLTITIMALGEIDGNSVSGVCFVGSVHHEYRAVFFLLPVFCALAVGGFFLSKSLLKLIRLKISSQEFISDVASAKIRSTIVRIAAFSVLIFTFGAVTFVCHIYEFHNSNSWHVSFRKYIVCRLVYHPDEVSECRMESRPSLAILQLHLLALFATGVAMSSWVWTNSTLDAWRRYIARLTHKEVQATTSKPKKHKIIASTYAKREKLNSEGHFSVSLHESYDPVGMIFELNSVVPSGSISTTWAAALPKLVTRRGALTGCQTNSNSSQRRNSMDSEISYSVRRVSVESRRHSLDSAVSVQVAEVTKTVRKGRRRGGHRVRSHRRRRSRHVGSRRNSSSSQESQLDAQILSVLAGEKVEIPPVKTTVHNQSRRQAITGFDVLAEKLFGNLAGPLDLSQSSEGSSEEEEVTQVRETLITGRLHTNTNSYYSEEERVAAGEEDEEEVNSDDVTQPFLALNYDKKHEPNIKFSKISSRSNNKSGNESDNECKRSRRKENGGSTEKQSNKTEKREYFSYPSCSDLENCSDDAKSKGKGSCRKIDMGVSTDSSLSPELFHCTQKSGTAVSVGSNRSCGREIGTQTNVSFSNKERSSSAGSKPKRKKSNASRPKPGSPENSLK